MPEKKTKQVDDKRKAGLGSAMDGISRLETDVVVVGAGIAGCMAAVAAADAGVKVIILEKMKDVFEAPPGFNNAKGNDTVKSGGGWGALFPYPFPETSTVDDVIKIGMEISGGRAFPDVCKALWSRLNDDFLWLKDTAKLPLKDRSTALRPNSFVTVGKGPGTARFGLSYAEAKGVKILYRHKAQKLLTDARGRVVGVRAMAAEGLKNVVARAVILATGGFQGNEEMKLKYLGRDVTIGTLLTGSPWNTGDGHRMALGIGAKMINMDTLHTRWCTHVTGHNPHRTIGVYGIYLNTLGKRYVDEAGSSNETSLATAHQPGSICALLIDAKVKRLDLVAESVRSLKLEKSGELMKSHTLEGVANRIGVDAVMLKRTVSDFNAAVNETEHRALVAHPAKGGERATAYRIEKPPFYFLYPLHAGLNHTMGGPLVNKKCQVLSDEDRVIPGLYAVGALAFGFMDGLYHITEMVSGLELALTMGRVAGMHAAADVKRSTS